MSPNLIDVHTHVQFAAYESDIREVINRALGAGVWMVNVGTQLNTSQTAVELADEYGGGVYATVGLHPIHTEASYHDEKELGGGEAAKAFTSNGEEFNYDAYKKLGEHEKVVAIGECGLDYYRLGEETKKRQHNVFEKQIELAAELGKPLMIHCREAFPDLIKILKAKNPKLKANAAGITHFFTGSTEDAKALIELGFYFSFGGVVTFTDDYNEVIKFVGLERIVLETDAPYVAPAPFRGKRNEPAYIAHTADKIAELLGTTADEVAEKTTINARNVLRI